MPSNDGQDGNKDSTMRYSSHLILAVAMITLGSCGRAPALTKAEDQRIDQPMARANAEQDRTNRARTHKQAIALELPQERSNDMAPIIVAGARPLPRDNLGQHPPPEIQIPLASGNVPAPPSRPAN
jgi:hypothetical protein